MHPCRNKASFYGEELSAHRPTPKLEDQPLSVVRDCLFNIFAATLHTGGPSSIHNLKARHLLWVHSGCMTKNGQFH